MFELACRGQDPSSCHLRDLVVGEHGRHGAPARRRDLPLPGKSNCQSGGCKEGQSKFALIIVPTASSPLRFCSPLSPWPGLITVFPSRVSTKVASFQR